MISRIYTTSCRRKVLPVAPPLAWPAPARLHFHRRAQQRCFCAPRNRRSTIKKRRIAFTTMAALTAFDVLVQDAEDPFADAVETPHGLMLQMATDLGMSEQRSVHDANRSRDRCNHRQLGTVGRGLLGLPQSLSPAGKPMNGGRNRPPFQPDQTRPSFSSRAARSRAKSSPA